MKCKITIAGAGLIAALFLSNQNAQAQDIHFTQFDASPLTLNPAFTGGFNGEWRASAVYRDQWRSILGGSAFKTIAASFDMPVIRDISVDDYLAAGVQVYGDKAGDVDLQNITVQLSVAYHKFLGSDGNKALTVGLQGGYSQKSFDLSKAYFGDEFIEGIWQRGTTGEILNTHMDAFNVNAGIAWSHAVSERFAYTIGGGVNNITQPLETFNRREINKDVGLLMRYTGQLGAVIGVGERFSLKPAVLFQSQATAMEIVAGNEFHYRLGDDYDVPSSTAVFAGVWYRHGDAIMPTIGVEWQGFKLGVAYDYNISEVTANGNGGFEIMIRYIAPSPLDFARKLLYPCGRF